jgi:hypothetical protein
VGLKRDSCLPTGAREKGKNVLVPVVQQCGDPENNARFRIEGTFSCSVMISIRLGEFFTSLFIGFFGFFKVKFLGGKV